MEILPLCGWFLILPQPQFLVKRLRGNVTLNTDMTNCTILTVLKYQ